MAKCELCGFDDNGSGDVRPDLRDGEMICSTCREIIFEALNEFDTEKCSEEYKLEHGIK